VTLGMSTLKFPTGGRLRCRPVTSNWALWGRVYTSSQNTLGMERDKKLLICIYLFQLC
jgi:hypothetical protein